MYRNLICLLILSLMLLLSPVGSLADGSWELATSFPDKTAEISLGEILSLAIDAERQRYYVIDTTHGQLVSFDNQGQLLASLNPGGRLQKPVSMVLAPEGRLWVVERATNQLVQVALQAQQVRFFDLTYRNGQALVPDKVARDATGQLYVLDRNRGVVARLDDNLQVAQLFDGGKVSKGFVDFELTDDGLWALDALGRRLVWFDADGKKGKAVALDGRLAFPVAFAVDAGGQFYLLDRHAPAVVVYDAQGLFSYDFLLKGKRPGQLWYPSELLFDWQGRLCVANEGNGRVDVFQR